MDCLISPNLLALNLTEIQDFSLQQAYGLVPISFIVLSYSQIRQMINNPDLFSVVHKSFTKGSFALHREEIKVKLGRSECKHGHFVWVMCPF